MAIGAWEHLFPVSKDVHPEYIDWPTEGYDVLIALFLHEIFTALDAIQDALGYDITGAYDTLKDWLDALGTSSHAQNTDKQIRDADGDSFLTVEETVDKDEEQLKLKNVEVRRTHDDGIVDLPKQSRCRAYLGTVQDVVKDTAIKIELDSEDYDSQNEFDKDTNYRFTAKKAGYYRVNMAVTLKEGQSLGDKLHMLLRKNGAAAATIRINQGNITTITAAGSDVVSLAVNDYLELFVFHEYSENRLVQELRQFTFMSIHKLS